MDRKEAVLCSIDRDGIGLEIGPSHAPIAAKKDGFKVEIIDHANAEDLIDKYTGHGVDINSIEKVDHIWQGESYAELTGKRSYYDWIIASHVIEHTPDIVSFLLNCNDVLNDEGMLSLAVPDYRYIFDQYRAPTGLSKVLEAFHEKRTRHSIGAVAEHYLYSSNKGGAIAWSKFAHGESALAYDYQQAVSYIEQASKDERYMDVHAWCFTPSLFRLVIKDLNSLGLCPLKEASFFSTSGCEFFITLSRSAQGASESRLQLMKSMQRELGGVSGFSGNVRSMVGLANKLRRSAGRLFSFSDKASPQE
jgi:hypothetical protein